MNQRILIAEDEAAVRESISMILSDEGFQCTTAADGQQAIDMVARNLFDLIILDYFMPRKNGREVLAKIRECSSQTKVIITSSYAEMENVFRGTGSGDVEFILKPIDFEELLETVRKQLA